MKTIDFDQRVGFAVGTGRCGTKFFSQCLEHEPDVAACHERHPVFDAFHRYCKWYDVPVDAAGYLQVKQDAIEEDLASHGFSLESNAHLSLSIRDLYERFNAKFVLLVRSPAKVVTSYYAKGWYDRPYVWDDSTLALGVQPLQMHHFFGRIAPRGEAFHRWNAMSRVGKLAWFWNSLNAAVLHQFSDLPASHWRVERLEDLDFECYVDLLAFMGIEAKVSEQTFLSIANKRPNTIKRQRGIGKWSGEEIEQFEREVRPMADHFEYEFRVDILKTTREAAPIELFQESRTDTAPADSWLARLLRSGSKR